MTQFIASKPSAEQVKAFAKQFLAGAGKSEEEIEGVMKVLEGLDKKVTPEGVVLIEDSKKWRDEAERAPYATPAAEVIFCVSIPTRDL